MGEGIHSLFSGGAMESRKASWQGPSVICELGVIKKKGRGTYGGPIN